MGPAGACTSSGSLVWLHPLSCTTSGRTYFLGRETVIVTDRPGMATWPEHLFTFLRRNPTSAASYFNLPTDRLMELSAQVEL